jgi:hypothetical protein
VIHATLSAARSELRTTRTAPVPTSSLTRLPGFSYLGPLADAILAGTVALRFLKTTLHWNAPALAFSEGRAHQFIRRQYRAGWAVNGLA